MRALTTRLTDDETVIDRNTARIGSAEVTIKSNTMRIDDLEDAADTANTRLDGHDTTLKSHDTRINAVNAAVDVINSDAGPIKVGTSRRYGFQAFTLTVTLSRRAFA